MVKIRLKKELLNKSDNPIVPTKATIANIAIMFFETILIKFHFSDIKDNRITCSSL